MSVNPSHNAITSDNTTTTKVACMVSLGEGKWTFDSSVHDSWTKLVP